MSLIAETAQRLSAGKHSVSFRFAARPAAAAVLVASGAKVCLTWPGERRWQV